MVNGMHVAGFVERAEIFHSHRTFSLQEPLIETAVLTRNFDLQSCLNDHAYNTPTPTNRECARRRQQPHGKNARCHNERASFHRKSDAAGHGAILSVNRASRQTQIRA
jgi:hypothetical protein